MSWVEFLSFDSFDLVPYTETDGVSVRWSNRPHDELPADRPDLPFSSHAPPQTQDRTQRFPSPPSVSTLSNSIEAAPLLPIIPPPLKRPRRDSYPTPSSSDSDSPSPSPPPSSPPKPSKGKSKSNPKAPSQSTTPKFKAPFRPTNLPPPPPRSFNPVLDEKFCSNCGLTRPTKVPGVPLPHYGKSWHSLMKEPWYIKALPDFEANEHRDNVTCNGCHSKCEYATFPWCYSGFGSYIFVAFLLVCEGRVFREREDAKVDGRRRDAWSS